MADLLATISLIFLFSREWSLESRVAMLSRYLFSLIPNIVSCALFHSLGPGVRKKYGVGVKGPRREFASSSSKDCQGSTMMVGSARERQGAPGNARERQGAPGSARECQGAPGNAREHQPS